MTETRSAIGSHSTSTIDKPWDGPAAQSSAPNDAAVLRYMHAWRNANGDPDAKSSYKFPHHAAGKDTAANIAACRNGLARLSQAKIPDGDRAGVERHLRKHMSDHENRTTSTSLPAIDIRGYPIEVREYAISDGDELPSVITGRILTYGTVDEYGTRWRKGVFTESLERRLPPILWAHNPELPIGRTRSFDEDDKGLVFTFELDDPEFVPMARQAAYQIKKGTVDEFSVGFARRKDGYRILDPSSSDGAYEEMTRAEMLENSVVPFGAVSGTGVIGMRALYLASGVPMWVPEREKITLMETKPEERMPEETVVQETTEVNENQPEDQPESDPGNIVVDPTTDLSVEVKPENDPTLSRIRNNSTMAIKNPDGKTKVVRVVNHPELQSDIVKSRRAARIAAKMAEDERARIAAEKAADDAAKAQANDDAQKALKTLRSSRR
ncbi:HK97 family phage prohead protease [Neptunomonas sp.]|uniref:HK97 family phage prohead protease n=1 Tax=Neptunomonas sp. TaxID=1971898 RepID=UPI003565E0BE